MQALCDLVLDDQCGWIRPHASSPVFPANKPAILSASASAALPFPRKGKSGKQVRRAGFAAALGEASRRLVCVARYALRGVGHSQKLFTLDPG